MLTAERLRELLHYDPETGVWLWRVSRQGARIGKPAGSTVGGYRRITIDGETYLCHRLAWLYVHGEWPSGWLDHAKGRANSIANLRPATASQNAANRGAHSNNTSGFKGVYFAKGAAKPWAARICCRGERVWLGTFTTKEEAHEVFGAAAAILFGEFARAA